MRRLHLLVEGQTEEILSQQVFIPHLEDRGWERVTQSVLTTRRLASGRKFRGGVSGWEKIRREIEILLPSGRDAPTSTGGSQSWSGGSGNRRGDRSERTPDRTPPEQTRGGERLRLVS